jgi:hypothetical protein
MMEEASTSETVNFYQTTRCYNPEDSHLQQDHAFIGQRVKSNIAARGDTGVEYGSNRVKIKIIDLNEISCSLTWDLPLTTGSLLMYSLSVR